MLKKLLLLGFVALMAGCASTGHKITDHTDRSTVYGWLDIDDVSGNHPYASFIRQYNPPIKDPYYGLNVDKFEGGLLYYFYGVPNGAFKLDEIRMQSCLGFICSNTIYGYSLGAQGDVATIKIKKPGTYYMGSYKMAEAKTGFFEPGKFTINPTKKGPSKKKMLEHILKNAPSGHPIVGQRIKAQLAKVK